MVIYSRYSRMSLMTAQCRGKKLMDKYMIAFRWLAQVRGAAPSCMYLTETTLAALKLTASVIQNIQLSGHPLIPLCPPPPPPPPPITDILLYFIAIDLDYSSFVNFVTIALFVLFFFRVQNINQK